MDIPNLRRAIYLLENKDRWTDADMREDNRLRAKLQEAERATCKVCGGNLGAGIAIAQTYVGGSLDFPGDPHPVTLSAGGPGEVVNVIKCRVCGHSFTESK